MLLVDVLKKYRVVIIMLFLLSLAGLAIFATNGETQAQEKNPRVKVMRPLQRDVPLSFAYVGTVKAKEEVEIQASVSGKVVGKYFTGGQYVTEGQVLYRIDARQYESALLSAQATLAQSAAILQNAEIDLGRGQELLALQAISEQRVTTQRSQVEQYRGVVASNEALVKKAKADVDDTVVRAPVSGRIGLKDIAVGAYVSSGSTTLATVGTSDPIHVQFTISENEYFKTISEWNEMDIKKIVHLTLGNNKQYPLEGSIEAVDRSLSENMGTLTVKAVFPNPNGELLPGMFARVRLSGKTVPHAILVPQRAVQQLLEKTFINIVDSDGKVEAREVKLGDKVGSYYIVEDGVKETDTVIVEGLVKVQDGIEVSVTIVTPQEMGFSLMADPDAEKKL